MGISRPGGGMTRRIILCADDFAQSPGISHGILQLVDAGRLSATSVFTESPHWRAWAPELAQRRQIDTGLHVNLTEPFVPGSRGLGYWLAASQLRLLSRPRLHARILAQIDAFADAMGRLPDYLDGHQHVHGLPVVRDALTDAIAQRWPGETRPYLRLPDRLADGGDSALKARVLQGCCRGFEAHARRCGLTGPGWFAGMYSLTPRADFAALMSGWLAAAPTGGLIMCHPGLPDPAADPIAATRPLEYAYLNGDAFADDCRQRDVALARYGAPAG
jgi:chitin disaccharide deacetylase